MTLVFNHYEATGTVVAPAHYDLERIQAWYPRHAATHLVNTKARYMMVMALCADPFVCEVLVSYDRGQTICPPSEVDVTSLFAQSIDLDRSPAHTWHQALLPSQRQTVKDTITTSFHAMKKTASEKKHRATPVRASPREASPAPTSRCSSPLRSRRGSLHTTATPGFCLHVLNSHTDGSGAAIDATLVGDNVDEVMDKIKKVYANEERKELEMCLRAKDMEQCLGAHCKEVFSGAPIRIDKDVATVSGSIAHVLLTLEFLLDQFPTVFGGLRPCDA
jgi:hypothetical protein